MRGAKGGLGSCFGIWPPTPSAQRLQSNVAEPHRLDLGLFLVDYAVLWMKVAPEVAHGANECGAISGVIAHCGAWDIEKSGLKKHVLIWPCKCHSRYELICFITAALLLWSYVEVTHEGAATLRLSLKMEV